MFKNVVPDGDSFGRVPIPPQPNRRVKPQQNLFSVNDYNYDYSGGSGDVQPDRYSNLQKIRDQSANPPPPVYILPEYPMPPPAPETLVDHHEAPRVKNSGFFFIVVLLMIVMLFLLGMYSAYSKKHPRDLFNWCRNFGLSIKNWEPGRRPERSHYYDTDASSMSDLIVEKEDTPLFSRAYEDDNPINDDLSDGPVKEDAPLFYDPEIPTTCPRSPQKQDNHLSGKKHIVEIFSLKSGPIKLEITADCEAGSEYEDFNACVNVSGKNIYTSNLCPPVTSEAPDQYSTCGNNTDTSGLENDGDTSSLTDLNSRDHRDIYRRYLGPNEPFPSTS